MPFPPGRIGTAEFYRRTGISKSSFFRSYRHEPHWRQRLDIREDPRNGFLTFSEAAVTKLATELAGARLRGRARRADNLYRDCPHCGEPTQKKAKICESCERDV